MLLHRSSQLRDLYQNKSQRLELTESLHDYFALNPKMVYNGNNTKQDNKDTKKSVKFADYSESGAIIYHDLSSSYRSLTSISDESIALDQTQHTRRASSDVMELDRTIHERTEV